VAHLLFPQSAEISELLYDSGKVDITKFPPSSENEVLSNHLYYKAANMPSLFAKMIRDPRMKADFATQTGHTLLNILIAASSDDSKRAASVKDLVEVLHVNPNTGVVLPIEQLFSSRQYTKHCMQTFYELRKAGATIPATLAISHLERVLDEAIEAKNARPVSMVFCY